MSEGLIAQIDALAIREYATRSDIIRQASLQYVRQSGIGEVEIKPAVRVEPKTERDFVKLAKKYPYVHPHDTELLEFLDDQANNGL